MATSDSAAWRQKGNDLFDQYTGSEETHLVLYKMQEHYEKAIKCATNHEERASGNKNCAKTIWRIVQHHIDKPGETDYVCGLFASAMTCFLEAAQSGSSAGKSSAWLAELSATHQAFINDILKYLSKFTVDTYTAGSEPLLKLLMDNHEDTPFTCKLALVKLLLAKGDRSLSQNNVQAALHTADETRRYFSKISSVNQSDYERRDVVVCDKRLKQLTGRAKATLKLHEGISMQVRGDADEVLAAADCFREAAELASTVDKPLEAEAYSYLGKLYEIKSPKKAAEFYEKALGTRNCQDKEWYSYAEKALEVCRQKMQSISPSASGQVGTLHDLHEMSESMISEGLIPQLLTWICEQYPPRISAKHVHSMDTTGSIRSMLSRMIKAYHPDKQDKSDVEWLETCSEITMILNKALHTV